MIGNTLFLSPMGMISGLPSMQGLFSFGVEPDVYLNFAGGYSKVAGVISPVANALTCVRASSRYVDDLSGNWTLVGANLPGISNKGLLVEETRTNGLRNNSMQGAVAGVVGSGGVLPTNWSILATNGLSTQVVGSGVVNGMDYIDLRIFGTTTGTFYVLAFDSAAANPASPSQVWSESLFAANVGGTLTNITAINAEIRYTGDGNFDFNFQPTISNALQRFSVTGTAGASTTSAVPAFSLSFANGVAIDATFRFGWPQLELGGWATSPIRTTNAAVTRAADVVTLTTPPTFGSAYTIYAAAVPNSPTSNATSQITLSLDDSTLNNRVQLFRSLTGGGSAANIVSGGVTGLNISGSPFQSTNVLVKEAIACAANDQQASFNGGLASPTGTGPLPVSVNTFHLGCRIDGAIQWNGYITEAAIWASARLTNAQLQAGTT